MVLKGRSSKRSATALWLGALAAGAAYVLMPAPGEAAVNSLEEAFVQAYRTNPTLLAQRAALRAVDENVNQAVSGWKPRVTASASYQVSDEQVDSVIFEPQFGFDVDGNGQLEAVQQSTETDATTLNYGVTIDQNVFRGFRTLNETRQAKANVQAAREQLKITEIQVLLDTVTAYMDVLRDEAVVRLSTNNVQVLSRQLEAAQDRFRVGEITRTDVAQAEARLSGAQSNLISAEAQLTNSRAAFEQVVGETPGGLIAPPELPALPGTEDEAENIALQQNPNLRSAKQAEEASRYAIRVARGALLPTVTLQAGYQVSDRNGDTVLTRPFQGVVQEFPNPVDDRDTDIASITVNVNVPLYQAGAEYSALRQAKQLNSEDKLQIVEAERNVVQQIANTWEALRSARATIQASREQVRANEIAFEGVQQEAQVGSRTTLDVLDAEQELLDSRVTLVTAERDEYVAAFQLLAATGFLTANRLNIQAPIYDPNDHYDKARSKWIGVGQRDDFR